MGCFVTAKQMVHINSIDIHGYKGIESISIDPKQINVITGRNNTGKTSILEGIEFGLSPKYAGNYGNNINNVININCEKAEVKLRTDGERENSKLREPDVDDKSVIYKKQIVNEIKKHSLVSTDEDLIDEDIPDVLEDIIAEHLDSLDKDEYKSIMENVLIIEHNGDEYPILYAENTFYSDLIEGNEDNIKKIFKEKNESIIEQNDIEFEEIYSTFEEIFKIVFSEKDILMRDVPYNPHETMITQHTSLDDDLKPKRDLNNDVKKVKVRDYLNDHDITPESGTTIDSFDFDNIVFNKNGEHYELPYNFMGDGYKTLIGFLWKFLEDSGISDIVYMEEPENHLHPGYIKQTVKLLVEMVKEENLQIYITTHSLDILSEFFSDSDDEQFLRDNFQLI